MKSVKEILDELGFNSDAPLSTQKAFLRHLTSAAFHDTNNRNQSFTQKPPQTLIGNQKTNQCPQKPEVMTQLEFDLSDQKRVS